MNREPQILLTNDDGIKSPGLWAAAEALDELGFVTVVAPKEQSSGTGRSFPSFLDGDVHQESLLVNGKEWTVHSLGGTPAMAVLYGVLGLGNDQPDLVVSGINYGLNVGSGVTISGTVGAALEGASAGIPSLAISLETAKEFHASYSREIDFSAAGYFTKYFAEKLLTRSMPEDVQVLKVEVPADADPGTPWQIARLSTKRFYEPNTQQKNPQKSNVKMGYDLAHDYDQSDPGTDSYTVINQRAVAVTPLSLDLTSRVSFKELQELLNRG